MTTRLGWGFLTILTLISGTYLFVLGQTGSEMIRGAILLMGSGFCLAMMPKRNNLKLSRKEEKEQ